MQTIRLFTLSLVCLMISSGIRAQFHWHITHGGVEGRFKYKFERVSSYHDVVTAEGIKSDTEVTTSERSKTVFLRSTDAGSTWTEQDPGLPHQHTDEFNYTVLAIQQIDSLNFVAVGDSGIIVRTTDGGATWIHQNVNPQHWLHGVHFSDALTGIAVGSGDIYPKDSNLQFGAIYTTNDAGQHWLQSAFQTPVWLSSCHSDGEGAFRVISPSQHCPIFRTTDNWATHDTGNWAVPANDTVDFVVGYRFNGNTVIGYGISGGFLGPAYLTYSTNSGVTWTAVRGLPDRAGPIGNVHQISELDRAEVFLATNTVANTMKILRSNDHGISWQIDSLIMDDPYLISIMRDITVTPSGHAVGVFSGGTYHTGDTQTGIEEGLLVRGDEMPMAVSVLTQGPNYLPVNPNPCHNDLWVGSTEVSSVYLFDALGRLYTVPNHDGMLDVSQLPAGVYYVSDGKQRARFVKE